MKIVAPSAHIEGNFDGQALLKQIELAGRTCYKSELKIAEGTAEKFVRGLIKSGHEAVIEHGAITVRFITDRGVTHEIVRHRIAAYCQESTRYCNYSKNQFGNEISCILPTSIEPGSKAYELWCSAMRNSEADYFAMLAVGCTPQQARAVLPNSLKTELVMTANPREWRHFFDLRCSPAAHSDIRYVALRLLAEFHEKIPVLFDDLYERFKEDIPNELVA